MEVIAGRSERREKIESEVRRRKPDATLPSRQHSADIPCQRATLVVMRRTLCVLGCYILAGLARAEAAPRNILLIMADDLNTMLGCYGDPRAQTPNLDRLAQRGVRFDQAYCTYPLCGPSRNSLLTGLYPNSTGIHENEQIFRQTIPKQPSLPQLFRQAGYFVARTGKLYHYNVPNSIGTVGHDDPASWEVATNPAGVDRTREHPEIFTLTAGQFGGTLSWLASTHPDAEHTDSMVASDACWLLRRCAEDRKPFFLAVGFFRPHTPYVAPKHYFDLYPEAEMRIVQGVEEDQKDIPEAALRSLKREEKEKLTDPLRRQALQAYYASITFMDAQVGRVLDALSALGLENDTTVIFLSDHGYHTGEHGLWQKVSLFEESVRVPWIVRVPGVTAPGAVISDPVSLVDLVPTLAELTGIVPPSNLQGQSLARHLSIPGTTGRGWALSQVSRGGGRPDRPQFFGYSLRTKRWRYTEWDQGQKGVELYDHDNDKRELVNLASDSTHADTVAKLRGMLADAIKSSMPPDGARPVPSPRPWGPLRIEP